MEFRPAPTASPQVSRRCAGYVPNTREAARANITTAMPPSRTRQALGRRNTGVRARAPKPKRREPAEAGQTGAGGEPPAARGPVRAGDGADEQHRVQVDVRVEPGEGQGGGQDRPAAELPVGGRLEMSAANRAAGGDQAVAEEERGPEPADHDQHAGGPLDDRADSGDPGEDQGEVGQRTHADDEQHVVPAQALAQDERVLGADRHDQRQAGDETGEDGEHVPTVGSAAAVRPVQVLNVP